MPSEKLLVMTDVDDAFWQRIKDRLKQHEVDLGAGPGDIWDVRDRGTDQDKIYLWGRDGWRDGFWHAMIRREGTSVWMFRGKDDRAALLTKSRARLATFVTPLFESRGDNEEPTAEHRAGPE